MARPLHAPGLILDGFRLEEMIHQGGMAMLWRVTRDGDNTPMLMKVPRIGGQRRYATGVLNYLKVIDVAKRAGFRMDEIRHLFHGFGKGTPAFRRWQ